MFDVGFWELALCFVIALLVLGPERLPRLARTLGSWVGRARSFVRQMSEEWEQEVDSAHWREEARRLREEMRQATRATADQMKTGGADAGSKKATGASAESDTASQSHSDSKGDDERRES